MTEGKCTEHGPVGGLGALCCRVRAAFFVKLYLNLFSQESYL